jgi:hypothetical protein
VLAKSYAGDPHMKIKLLDIDDDTYRSLGIDKISKEEWDALYGFWRREWFNRVWVVQELIFANAHVYVVGDDTIDSTLMNRVSKLIFASGWHSQMTIHRFLSEEDKNPKAASVAALY